MMNRHPSENSVNINKVILKILGEKDPHTFMDPYLMEEVMKAHLTFDSTPIKFTFTFA